MKDEAGEETRGPGDSNVADYKLILRRVLDNRPSGTRLKLAAALGKNRSFVTQITNPVYLVPIPAKHVAIIFEVCHLSGAERTAFLEAYGRAHPGRLRASHREARTRHRFCGAARALHRERRLTDFFEPQVNNREGVYEKTDQRRRDGTRRKS